MIKDCEITQIGSFGKPHGISGEIAAGVDIEADDLSKLSCIVLKIDGINVPFFISQIRPKGRETVLLKIDGIDSEKEAKNLSNLPLYALKNEILFSEESDTEDFYLSDLVGYEVYDSEGQFIGKVSDYDDSTSNALLFVSNSEGKTIYIPAANEFFIDINLENQTLTMQLPEGLTDL